METDQDKVKADEKLVIAAQVKAIHAGVHYIITNTSYQFILGIVSFLVSVATLIVVLIK